MLGKAVRHGSVCRGEVRYCRAGLSEQTHGAIPNTMIEQAGLIVSKAHDATGNAMIEQAELSEHSI